MTTTERFTRKDAEQSFKWLCQELGKREAERYNDVFAWTLDYSADYGGFVVYEISNDHGAVRCPLGERRMKAREFCQSVRFAISCLESGS